MNLTFWATSIFTISIHYAHYFELPNEKITQLQHCQILMYLWRLYLCISIKHCPFHCSSSVLVHICFNSSKSWVLIELYYGLCQYGANRTGPCVEHMVPGAGGGGKMLWGSVWVWKKFEFAAGRRGNGGRVAIAAAATEICRWRRQDAKGLVKSWFFLKASRIVWKLCWLRWFGEYGLNLGFAGFPAARSLCLRLLMCCLSCVSELTCTSQISQWKVLFWSPVDDSAATAAATFDLTPDLGKDLIAPSPLLASNMVLCLVPLLWACSWDAELTATLQSEQ